MRVFCRYLNDVGIKAYIPPSRMTRKPPKYDAHIYTPDELRRFFEAVDKSRSVPSECPYRGMVMPVFFRILYTSGMRVSELRLARIRDVDLERCCIFVRGGTVVFQILCKPPFWYEIISSPVWRYFLWQDETRIREKHLCVN